MSSISKTMIYSPKYTEIITLREIDLRTIAQYINWEYFFSAWKITGRYDGIEQVCVCPSCEEAWLQKTNPDKREKAKEALQLFRHAQELLLEIITGELFSVNATFLIANAKAENEGITFYLKNNSEKVYIPMLRQQQEKTDGYNLSLSDYVSPVGDYVGIFAVTIKGSDELRKKYDDEHDTYKSLLAQTLADRFAEAATEYIHEQIRKKYWGYAPDENPSIEEMKKSKYQGIRPAVGYPSLPDQSVVFFLDKILDFGRIGISITENGAMHPSASTCGLLFAHPQAKYFVINKIGEDQLKDYASRKNISVEEAKKWLGSLVS